MIHAKFQNHRPYCSTLLVYNTTCQVLLKLVHRFRRFRRVFTIYGHGGHLGHVTWIIYEHTGFLFLQMLHIKFGFDRFQRRRSLNIMVIYMYIAPRLGQTSPCGPNIFRITNLPFICPFPSSFSLQMTF